MKLHTVGIILGVFVFVVGLAGCATSNQQVASTYPHHRDLASQHQQQGIVYVNQGDYQNAIAEFKRSIEIYPTVNAYANLGGTYMQVGKNNLAMDALKKAEGINPYDTLTLYNLTALNSKMNKADIALVYLDKALANGFNNYNAIRFDPDLTNIRGEPEFRKVLEKNKVFLQ